MEDYRSGDVVLLCFPYGDVAEAKRRPALVLLDTGDDDIVVARITAQSARTKFDVELQNWRQSGSLLPSVVWLHKVATLEKRLVERKLGTLTKTDREDVQSVIRQLWTSP